MIEPHVCIKVSSMSKSLSFYQDFGYELDTYQKCDSLDGAIVMLLIKGNGFPNIELVESLDDVVGIDHVTVGISGSPTGQPDIVEEKDIPELGVSTRIFRGPDGEKLEVYL